ncbi:MAG: hypothetical protein KC505_10095 [Myxococcales bacterium]|nr:hypothetical protein [Myxococcales bacterium]
MVMQGAGLVARKATGSYIVTGDIKAAAKRCLNQKKPLRKLRGDDLEELEPELEPELVPESESESEYFPKFEPKMELVFESDPEYVPEPDPDFEYFVPDSVYMSPVFEAPEEEEESKPVPEEEE